MIRYADIVSDSIVDGPGIRVTAFLQGCPRRCQGCHNPSLLPTEGGIEVTEREFAKLLLKKLTKRHGGLTLSGGDPLLQSEALDNVLAFIKKRIPDLNVWIYTGYLYEDVKELQILRYVDVLVDGPFIEMQKDISLIFKGSANQRIIDVPKSLLAGEVVELDLRSNVVNG